MRIVKPSATLDWVTPNALEVIERKARKCYKSEGRIGPGSAEKLIRKILLLDAQGEDRNQPKHESVLEHAVVSWDFVCDRGISHELVRHRLASYSQESTRYCNYSGDKFGNEISVIQPPGLTGSDYIAWERGCLAGEYWYLNLIANKVAPQIARSVLPTCLKTEIGMTCNFTEWRHVLKLRAVNPRAHPQIREIMMPVLEWFRREYPVIVEDIV